MTVLLEQTLAEIAKLTPEQQDSIAEVILEELADEEKWEQAFANSQQELSILASKVREDIAAGKVREAGFDAL